MKAYNLKVISLEILIIIIGVIGTFVLIGMAIAWRRYLRRQKTQENDSAKKEKDNEYISIWEQSAKRLNINEISEYKADDIDLKRNDLPDDDES